MSNASEGYSEAWWKEAVVYQVWPHSFFDSNGDGIGDLNGIRSKLDHIQELGANVIWLSPCYASPNHDFGYDISDYEDINPLYGTLDDWQALCDDINGRGMRLIMDLVSSHTSEDHPWFVESRSSKDNPKRDFYFWRPKREGEHPEPNNWAAVWGQQSAWELDPRTDEYFLRIFTGKQADYLESELGESQSQTGNIRHDEPLVCPWHLWLPNGCHWISKPHEANGFDLISAPIMDKNRYHQLPMNANNGPRCHEFIQMMHKETLSKYDHFTVGEFAGIDDPKIVADFVKPERKELQTLILFEHILIDGGFDAYVPFKLSDWKRVISKWQRELPDLGGWNSIYIQNHDAARAVSRFGNDSLEFRVASAKLLMTMEATLTGTLYIYQGEEIGMTNFPKDWPVSEYLDIASQNNYHHALEARRSQTGEENPDMSDVVHFLQRKARDHARTPVQWDDTEYAGFSKHKPWMRVNPNKDFINVKAQQADPESNLSFTKKILRFRKQHKACTYGVFDHLDPTHEQVFAYTKTHQSEKLLVILNFSDTPVSYKLPSSENSVGTLLISNLSAAESKSTDGHLQLKAWEARIYQLNQD